MFMFHAIDLCMDNINKMQLQLYYFYDFEKLNSSNNESRDGRAAMTPPF